ncbi:hypothetical protein [Jeotgalibacillus malaysiensis]|uniref:hypothetical protein n=1 Tax=Jeotgalibacillus malaysiensis TaxID=1508404 RepID=UPI00384FB779
MNDPWFYNGQNNNSSGISSSRLAVIAAALTTVADVIGTIAAIKAVKEEELSNIEDQKRQDQQNQMFADLQAQIVALQSQVSADTTSATPVPAYSITIENLNLTLPYRSVDQKNNKGTDP